MDGLGDVVSEISRLPWYATIGGGLLGSLILAGWVKNWLSKQGLLGADDRATVNSIAIYKGLVDELRQQLQDERESRKMAEAKHDELLQKYAGLTGEIAALRLTIEHQSAQITEQNEAISKQDALIVSLRDDIASLKAQYDVA